MSYNAADPAHVKPAGRREKRRESLLMASVRTSLQSAATRLVFWELLERAGVFRSIWESSARIHYNAGRQDFGHELMALLVTADEQLYETMEREARGRVKRDAREAEAVVLPAATEDDAVLT